MPADSNKGKNTPIIRLLFALFTGVGLGYLYFSPTLSPNSTDAPKGKICLVIDDFGFAQNQLVEDFINLDENITLAVIPSAPYSKTIGKMADSLGIETIIHMPMESYEEEYNRYNISLHNRLNEPLVEEKISAAFAEIPTDVGMNNHQ